MVGYNRQIIFSKDFYLTPENLVSETSHSASSAIECFLTSSKIFLEKQDLLFANSSNFFVPPAIL